MTTTTATTPTPTPTEPTGPDHAQDEGAAIRHEWTAHNEKVTALRAEADTVAQHIAEARARLEPAQRVRAGFQRELAGHHATRETLLRTEADNAILRDLDLGAHANPQTEQVAALDDQIAGLNARIAAIDGKEAQILAQIHTLSVEEERLRTSAEERPVPLILRQRAHVIAQARTARIAYLRAIEACGGWNASQGWAKGDGSGWDSQNVQHLARAQGSPTPYINGSEGGGLFTGLDAAPAVLRGAGGYPQGWDDEG